MLRAPVEHLRQQVEPRAVGTRKICRERNLLRPAALPRPHKEARVDVESQEIHRLRDVREIAALRLRAVAAGHAPVSRAVTAGEQWLEHAHVLLDEGAPRRRDVLRTQVERERDDDVVGQAGARAPAAVLAHRAHAVSVREQRVVVRLVDDLLALAAARRLATGAVAQPREAENLVQRDPVFHAVTIGAHNGVGVAGEGLRRAAHAPATAVLQHLRQVPVEHRHPRGDAVLLHRVEEPVVEIHALLVHRAVAVGQNARPRQRQPVIPDAELPHQGKILVEAPVMVAGRVERVAVEHGARLAAEGVPHRRAFAVGEGGALDLRGGRGHAPGEPGGEAKRCHAVYIRRGDRRGCKAQAKTCRPR